MATMVLTSIDVSMNMYKCEHTYITHVAGTKYVHTVTSQGLPFEDKTKLVC